MSVWGGERELESINPHDWVGLKFQGKARNRRRKLSPPQVCTRRVCRCVRAEKARKQPSSPSAMCSEGTDKTKLPTAVAVYSCHHRVINPRNLLDEHPPAGSSVRDAGVGTNIGQHKSGCDQNQHQNRAAYKMRWPRSREKWAVLTRRCRIRWAHTERRRRVL